MKKLYTVSKNYTGTDCASDHELLIAKFRLKLKKVGKTTRLLRYDLNQIPYDYTAALNMPANLKNSSVATGMERSVFIPIPKKGNAKECSNYHTTALTSYASKVMLKILQDKL